MQVTRCFHLEEAYANEDQSCALWFHYTGEITFLLVGIGMTVREGSPLTMKETREEIMVFLVGR